MKTKKEFFKMLRQLLLWKYNENGIKATLDDYEEYFNIGKSFGKSEERMCAELGSPLAIVREVYLEDVYKNRLGYLFNKKIMIRLILLVILAILFMWPVYRGVWTQIEYKKIFILYLIMCLLGWYLLGGKLFSLAWLGQVEDPYRSIKITIVHSIYLLMAIISVSLISKVFLSWDIIYAYNSAYFRELKAETVYALLMMLIIVVVIMVSGIYEYRYHGIEYYSIVCHGIGLICTILEYMNVLNKPEYWRLGIMVVLKCEGVYVESILLSSLFIVYSQYVKK